MAERIGFIGLGNMGDPMTRNIVQAGFGLTVYDVDAELTARIAREIGAKAAASPEELGKASDIVITMLPTGAIVHSVVLEQGLAQGLAPGSLIVDMSSSAPTTTVELGRTLAERGIHLIDAPVSGAVPRAKTGTLTIMAGTDDAAQLERACPVLQAMGEKIFPTGPLGTGHAMKALNNFSAAAGFAAASEALILGERFGLDPKTAVEIMNVSTGRNFSTEMTIPGEVLTERFASGFALALLAKDVGIAAQLSHDLGADLPLVAQTDRWWDAALKAADGPADHTTAYRHWKAQADREVD
ncbi:NAD(P)-dependent oxidoreductase [Roseibium sp.]|uniref:NAD(P)-dependent oxidoreductase n=1 Tax=Roseibium sp. TaxID=1936156 RepID=UPI003A977185